MKKSVFVLLAAAALVSCSKDDVQPVPADSTLISLKSVAYTAGASTRAPFEGNIATANPLTALVPSREIAGDYATTWALGTFTFNNPTIAASYNTGYTGTATFPSPADEVNAFGLYPASATDWTLAATTATYTFSGKEDVLAAKEVLIKKTEVAAGTYQTLAFNHLLTKLKVQFRGEADVVAGAGTIKSVEWVANIGGTGNLENVVTFTPASAAVAFAQEGTPKSTLPFYKATETAGVTTYTDNAYAGQAYTLTVTPTLQAYALVKPVGATPGVAEEYFLKVVRTGTGTDVTNIIPFDLIAADGTAFNGNTAGHAFTVVVNYLKKDVIKAVATVTDWEEEGEYVAGVEVI